MSTKVYDTILLKGDAPQEELPAFAAITPGQIVERKSDGTVRRNSVAGVLNRSIAVEDDLQGRDINNAYAATDIVFIRDLRPGDWAFAFVAAGVAYAFGDKLSPDASGTLRKSVAASQLGTPTFVTTPADVHVFEILDPAGINLTAGGAVATRVAVRAL